jgi:hypothetical protein
MPIYAFLKSKERFLYRIMAFFKANIPITKIKKKLLEQFLGN